MKLAQWIFEETKWYNKKHNYVFEPRKAGSKEIKWRVMM